METPSDGTSRELHDIVQAVFGLDGYHSWAFEAGQDVYGLPGLGLGMGPAPSRGRRACVAGSTVPTDASTAQ
ncbi:hypothetical protein [Streptomyces sp. NPDC005181]|uniref:hypothetical protein n=1 Tax=Streptomyces sp. NPDC005181 TaxID=3156869 RepID=UPI0033A644E6